uniref:Chromatin modification-related protein n=1 Tax=Bionectria ochroleuca TaxID=29856 RepID=A0A0B7JT29_BIOOC
MKSAKPSSAEPSSHRRSQPVRQTRTNPPRSSATLARNASGNRESFGNGATGDQSIDIFPAITFFADTITALPKELVRHFTLLREVDAKLSGPQDQLFKLVSAATNAPWPETRPQNEMSSVAAPASAPMSAQNSSSGTAQGAPLPPPSTAESIGTSSSVFDPSNIPRRQLFRQTAFKITEMLVALEEKNHVINTANEALQKQLARIEDMWPYLENEFSDEAKWGSSTHWAYPENRTGKSSDARKQAVQAKKNSKNHHQDSDFDDHDHRHHKGETSKKPAASKARKTAEANSVGLGISASAASNGNHPSKKRKVENISNEPVLQERAMSTVFGPNASRGKPSSGNGSPVPEGPKKRKALPTGSTQAKKKNGAASPSIAGSPVLSTLPEPKGPARASPAPNVTSRPVASRARQNSIQSGPDNNKPRSALPTSSKTNGIQPEVPEPAPPVITTQEVNNEPAPVKEPVPVAKPEAPKKEPEKPTEAAPVPPPSAVKKETKAEELERRKSESLPPGAPGIPTVTTKSGRASKPSTPAMANLQEPPRPRASRNGDSNGKKGHRKTNSMAHLAPPTADDEMTSGDGEFDADEPTYCYCNGVSYGEMVACDSDECTREWFHLACVGLKVAPGEKSKWYCEDCKERLKIGNKKGNGR